MLLFWKDIVNREDSFDFVSKHNSKLSIEIKRKYWVKAFSRASYALKQIIKCTQIYNIPLSLWTFLDNYFKEGSYTIKHYATKFEIYRLSFDQNGRLK